MHLAGAKLDPATMEPFNMVSKSAQPIRYAITVAGIPGNSRSSARTCTSTPSASVGRGARS